MKLHFISGLPRSGTTLFTALLRQNPKFYANISSPLSELLIACETAMGANKETSGFVNKFQRHYILEGLFKSYYKSTEYAKYHVFFDNSRLWTSKIHLLKDLFPDSKFILFVREMGWIADSFERLYRKNNQQPSGIFGWAVAGTVFDRIEHIMKPENVLGFAYNATLEALSSGYGDKILLIDYELFVNKPDLVVNRVYEFIEEEPYEHNFEKVEFNTKTFDAKLGAPGLHTVKGPIEWRPRETILPINLFNEINAKNFWRINT